MRNLLVFLVRNYLVMLFLLLEGLSMYFLVQHNVFQRAAAVSAANSFTGSIYETRSNFTAYLNLKDQNEMLNHQLAALLNRGRGSFIAFNTATTNVNDTVYRQRYQYLTAEVVDNSVTLRSNYIILDRGSKQGVAPDMGVIGASGIIGIVREVSDNFCVVMSVLHKDTKISASVKKDGTFGQLLWNGGDYRTADLIDLPTHSKIAQGDTLVTSGLGDAFPQGVPVGVVKNFEKKAGDKTYTVEVQLTTDFRKLKHVLLIKDLFREEIQQLKQRVNESDNNAK